MAGPIRIAILANGRQARREIGGVSSSLGRLGRLARSGAAAAGLGSLAYAAGRFAVSAVKAEAEFSTSMRLIQAATKAPASAMGKLNDLAIKLGADTSFSASEAADAMLELAKAGIDTKTIMGGGLAGTLQLAAAGGTELGTAATIASNALNTFGLKGKDMASVAAALAGGANASSASVESLGQALQQVGPGATNAGLSLQETVAALSAFDAAGIKGSDAGTSLKTMLTRLIPASEKAEDALEKVGLQTAAGNSEFVKANGEFESLTTIAGALQKRLDGLSAKQRQVALTTIFGSDASRAATVLMKEGETGLRSFIKATKDQSAAQKMAEARMGGTAGALERLSGSIETAKLRLGQELAPAVELAADWLAEQLVPAMDDGIDYAKKFGTAVAPAAKQLLGLAKVAGQAVGWLLDLPDPVKQLGVQAGIAALILPRLTASVTSVTSAITLNIARLKQFQAEMTYTATRTQAASAAMTRLGTAARGAAGVGGILALTQASQQSNKALTILGSTAGGTMLGFSVGGPWGAAVGAGAGALFGLYQSTKKSSGAMGEAKAKAAEYAAAIDRIAAASGRAQRAETLALLQKEGMIPIANQLGITTQELIAATLGNAKAQARIRNAYKSTTDVLVGLQRQKLSDWLTEQGFALDQAARKTRANEQALKRYTGETRQAPKSIQKLNDSLRNTGNVKPNLGKFQSFFRGELDKAATTGKTRAQKINTLLLSTTAKARPNLAPFKLDLLQGLNSAERTARSGGNQVGSAIGSGVAVGIGGAISQVTGEARRIVMAGIAAAKDAAGIASPSRRMREIGELMGDGLREGIDRRRRDAESAGNRLARSAMAGAHVGVTGTYSPNAKALDAYMSVSGSGRGGRVTERVVERLPRTIVLDAGELGRIVVNTTQAVLDADRTFDRTVRGQ